MRNNIRIYRIVWGEYKKMMNSLEGEYNNIKIVWERTAEHKVYKNIKS